MANLSFLIHRLTTFLFTPEEFEKKEFDKDENCLNLISYVNNNIFLDELESIEISESTSLMNLDNGFLPVRYRI